MLYSLRWVRHLGSCSACPLAAVRLGQWREVDECPPVPSSSSKPAEQNGGASAAGRGVGWVPTPASGLEVCRYFESLSAIRYGSSNGNNRCTPDNTAFEEGTGIKERQAVEHDRNRAVAVGVVVVAALSSFDDGGDCLHRQSSMPSLSIQSKACFSLFTGLPFWWSSVRPLV